MKLNPECLCDVLFTVESLASGADNPWIFSGNLPYQLLPYTYDEVMYHVDQCEKLSYLDIGSRFIDGSCEILGLTANGHAELEKIRNPEVRRRAIDGWRDAIRDGLVSASISGFFSAAWEIAKTLRPE